MGMDQYLLIPFLVGWTSIYQLFWCELQGYKVLTGEDRVSQQGCESANLSQPTERRESANRKARVSQQEGASQPTGRRESANQEGASQPTGRRESANQEGASQPTRSRVSQPGRESTSQVASQPTRSRVSQPCRGSANQVASQPTRSRVSQPGRESTSQVASQPTLSRVSQPGCESANPVAGQTTRSRVRQRGRTQDMKRKEMKWGGAVRGHERRGEEFNFFVLFSNDPQCDTVCSYKISDVAGSINGVSISLSLYTYIYIYITITCYLTFFLTYILIFVFWHSIFSGMRSGTWEKKGKRKEMKQKTGMGRRDSSSSLVLFIPCGRGDWHSELTKELSKFVYLARDSASHCLKGLRFHINQPAFFKQDLWQHAGITCSNCHVFCSANCACQLFTNDLATASQIEGYVPAAMAGEGEAEILAHAAEAASVKSWAESDEAENPSLDAPFVLQAFFWFWELSSIKGKPSLRNDPSVCGLSGNPTVGTQPR